VKKRRGGRLLALRLGGGYPCQLILHQGDAGEMFTAKLLGGGKKESSKEAIQEKGQKV